MTVGLLALLAFAAWSTESGQVWSAREQLRAATDASALAGAGELIINNSTTVDEPGARTTAQTFGGSHDVLGQNLSIAPGDVEVGSWDLATRTFTPIPGGTDPNQVRAVRVSGRRTAALNGPIATVLGRLVGVTSIDVSTQAVGYVGFAGSGPPGLVDLPITIDCCAISGNSPGSACTQDYCSTIQNSPPNPCPLQNGTTVSCLEFFATPDQNACWSEFDAQSSSVNTPGLQSIVQNQNQTQIGPDPIYVDNGTKTPVISDIRDRFLGQGSFSGNPSGIDRDGDGQIDSWPVTLPVVECQNPGSHCASGNPAAVVGFVCFDVQEVLTAPQKIIKGEFVCPTDPRFAECPTGGFGPGGTVNTGFAALPVLVR